MKSPLQIWEKQKWTDIYNTERHAMKSKSYKSLKHENVSSQKKSLKHENVSSQKKSVMTKKRFTVKKVTPRWKVVGNKVHFPPGDYTLTDIETALKAIKGVS